MPEQTTVDDVIAHVAATDGWFLDRGAIRRRLKTTCRRLTWTACPISSMANLSVLCWGTVAHRHCMSGDDVERVVAAADGRHLLGDCARDADLRRRLLAAAKLTEQDA